MPAMWLAGLWHAWHLKALPRAARLPLEASSALPGLLGFFPGGESATMPRSPGPEHLVWELGRTPSAASNVLAGLDFQSTEKTETNEINK